MGNTSPKFANPPLVETVASAQFAPLDGFSTALVGWFWKGGFLSKEWTQVAEAPRLEDQFEKFDGKGGWGRHAIKLLPPGQPERIQIIQRGGDRMIQVQNTRFIFNWRKQEGNYPGYTVLAQEFRELFAQFQSFLRGAGFEDGARLNQWEITYVNHLPKGELWDSPKDWGKIFPKLYYPAEGPGATLDTMGGNWRYTIGGKGRLYVAMEHAKTMPPDMEGGEVLALNLTARGPIGGDHGVPLGEGLNLGHDSIVNSFTAMTSSEAQRHWERRD